MISNTLNSLEIVKVQLNDINIEDKTFKITTDKDEIELENSIKTIGLLSIPILREYKGKITIISGFRRITICKKIGYKDIDVKIFHIDENRKMQLHCEAAKIAITDNSFVRSLNLIEQARAINLLSLFCNDKSIQLPGLTLNPKIIKKLNHLLCLPNIIHDLIISNIILLPVALELGEFDINQIEDFAYFFKTLNLSFNKQKEFITLCKEIALRDDIAISKILYELKQIMQKYDDLDSKQKQIKIRHYLKQRRFPTLTQVQENFKATLKKLKLDPNTKLIPPNNFEGVNFSLNFTFKNLQELEERKKTFNMIIDNPLIKEIFSN